MIHQIQCTCESTRFVVRRNDSGIVQIKCPDCLAILAQEEITLKETNHEEVEDFDPKAASRR